MKGWDGRGVSHAERGRFQHTHTTHTLLLLPSPTSTTTHHPQSATTSNKINRPTDQPKHGEQQNSQSLPEVTIGFCAPESLRPLEASPLARRAAKEALELFSSAVRTALCACGGYECQEKDGVFMVAFADAGE